MNYLLGKAILQANSACLLYGQSILSPHKQPNLRLNCSFIIPFCVFFMACVIIYILGRFAAFCFSLLSPHSLDACTSQSCKTPMTQSLFVIVCY